MKAVTKPHAVDPSRALMREARILRATARPRSHLPFHDERRSVDAHFIVGTVLVLGLALFGLFLAMH